jgi:hypothetical protein
MKGGRDSRARLARKTEELATREGRRGEQMDGELPEAVQLELDLWAPRGSDDSDAEVKP